MQTTRRDLVVGGAASTLLSTATRAQTAWPSQPVKVVVTQAAGGTPDIVCRMVMERLSKALGQQIFIENKPGAGNVIGAQAARAAPDGYTLLWSTAASLITNVFTVKALPYEPKKDFVNIVRAAKGPFIVVAHPSLPADNLRELIALAKSRPGALSIATDGPRNFSGLVAAWLNKTAGIDIKQVPYATMPQGIQDTIAGRLELAVLAIPSAGPQMAAGKLKPIGVTSAQRAPGYETATPIAETLPGFDFYGWLGVAAPAGVPRPILERLNAEIGKILEDKEFAEPLAKIGFYSLGAASLEKAAAEVNAEFDVWKKVVTEIGLEPE